MTYAVEPANVALVSTAGEVSPLADGRATIIATRSDASSSTSPLTARVTIGVERFKNPDPVNFPNQIVPIFTKTGCNTGGCHGKFAGQNGFRLSLLGFEPKSDYRFLVQTERGGLTWHAGRWQFLPKPDRQLGHNPPAIPLDNVPAPRSEQGAVDDWYRSITEGIEPGISGRNNLETLAVCEMTVRSATLRRPVDRSDLTNE